MSAPLEKIAFSLLLFLIALPIAVFAEKDYTIGPRDILQITVFDEPKLSKDVAVDEDGNIRLPWLREVKVGGLTLRKAEDYIEQLLKRYLKRPQVTILVKEYNSQKVYVLGAVKSPGSYPLTGDTTLLEIISKAGGIIPEGGKTILLVRGGANQQIKLKKLLKNQKKESDVIEDFTSNGRTGPIVVNGHKLLDEGDTTLNYVLEPGDLVYIPKVEKVFVMGEVKRPGGIAFKEGLTVLKAITLAGGITPMARNTVLVKRNEDGQEKTYKVSLRAVIKDSKKDILLKQNDVIVIKRRIF